MGVYMGLDIGGTKCAAVAGALEGENLRILAREAFATPRSQEEAMDRLCALAGGLAQGRQILGVGISSGGPMDAERGMLCNPPNLPGWSGLSLTDYARARLHAPALLENDANACALAEWLYGAGEKCRNMIFLTFGTGLGAGLILDGKLYEGTNGNAGEVGHIRLSENGPVGFGKFGSFEGFCSGGGIAQLGYTLGLAAYQRGERPLYFNPDTAPKDITAKSVAIAAEQHGDPTAIEVYRLCGEYLGRGLSILIDLLNPERIVIGSIFTRSRNGLWESCKEVIDREALEISRNCCEVVPAKLLEGIGDYAALTVGVYQNGKDL